MNTNYTIWCERNSYLENVIDSLSEIYKKGLLEEIKVKTKETGKNIKYFPTWQQIIKENNLERQEEEEKNKRK